MTVALHTERTNEIIERLRAIKTDVPVIVSCYVRLDPASRQRQAYLRQLKPRMQEILEGASDRGLDPDAIERLRADLAAILSYLEPGRRLPPTGGLAMFVSGDLDLFEVVPLARVHRTRIDIDGTPLLKELVDCWESVGRYLAVAIDRGSARFFEVTATTASELTGETIGSRLAGRFHPDRRNAPGVGERDFHQQQEEEQVRLSALTIQRIIQLLRADHYAGVALLGPDEHTRALSESLPRSMSGALLGKNALRPSSATPSQIASAVWQLRLVHEGMTEATLLGKVEDDISRGLAVNGARETLHAIELGQVRVLIVPENQTLSGYRGAQTGRLGLEPDDLDGDTPIPTPNLTDWAIEAVLAQRGTIQVIESPDLARRIAGLAARLRFAEG